MSTKPKTESQIEIDELRAAFDKKVAQVLSRITGAMIKEIDEAKDTILAMDSREQSLILNDEKLVKSLAALGFFRQDKATGKPRNGGGGGKFKKFKDLILAELATGPKKQKFLEEKFGVSHQTLRTWATSEDKFKGLVEVNEDGRENEWSKL